LARDVEAEAGQHVRDIVGGRRVAGRSVRSVAVVLLRDLRQRIEMAPDVGGVDNEAGGWQQ